ncbi:MAG: ABC transporter ATP-binding protein, partial [Candidatus Limnocylindria bacterium]
ALVHDPRLLLLDEPTNGLDPAGRDEMLDLIYRTGTEFGIAIIMASHLLGEIERVAGWLVAIDAGRLLRTASLSSFTERTGQLLVETDEPAAELAERLVARGLEARADARIVLVDLASGGDGEFTVYDAVRDEAVALRLGLVRIEASRHQLEDLFRVGGTDDGGS